MEIIRYTPSKEEIHAVSCDKYALSQQKMKVDSLWV